VQWLDEKTGLPCLVKRNPMGAWCGYVGVSDGHPAFEKRYDEVGVDVHGGLTYSGFCQPHDLGHEDHAICHVVEDGEDDRVWWLGFDCGHSLDLVPQMKALEGKLGFPLSHEVESYKTISYVRAETLGLAAQLHNERGTDAAS
jgi:hypothetical protein